MASSWTNQKKSASRVQSIRQVRIYAFKASEDKIVSERFLEEHKKVIFNHGIDKLTSMNTSWIDDPNVYVLVVTSPAGTKLYGGARLHLLGESSSLPLQDAVRPHDAAIDTIVNGFAEEGCAELCAMWNKTELAGLGLGGKMLLRCAISMCHSLNVQHLLALSSPVTRRWVAEFGFENIPNIANDGKIPYPDDRFVATVAHYYKKIGFERIQEEHKAAIQELGSNPLMQTKVKGVKGTVTVHFDLI